MIKLRRLKIENFTILKEVMGKDNMELNFTDNPICIIVGKNGSGKSFIMSLLSPAPVDLVRNRSGNPAIPDKTGLKELDFELDGKYLYKIKIEYDPKKTTCLIHKYNKYTNEDLGELNPNGNVNTYFDVLDKELGYTKHYLNIGYLSGSITNIIAMKPTERSAYISVWLPQLSEFINSFKIVSKKSNMLKRQIDMLNEDIGKLSDTDYDIIIENHNKNIYELETAYRSNLNEQSKTKAYINIVKDVSKEELETKIFDFKRKVKLLNQERIEIMDEKDLLSKYSGKSGKKLLNDTINKCSSELSVLGEKINNIDSNISNIENELNEIKSDDKEMDNDTFINIETTINSLKEEIDNLESIKKRTLIDNPHYSEIENISKSDIDIFKSFLSDLKDIRNKITSLVDSSYLKDNDYITSSNDKFSQLIDLYEIDLDKLEDSIMTITNKIYLLKNSDMSYMMNLKPPACNVNSCGVLEELMKYVNPNEEIKKLQLKLDGMINSKSELINKISKIKEDSRDLSQALDIIADMNNRIFNKKDLIAKMPSYIRKSFEDSDMCSVLNAIPIMLDKIEDFSEYIYLIEKLAISNQSMGNSLVTYNLLKQKKSINEKWSKLHENRQKMMSARQILISDFNKNENLEKRLKDLNILSEQNGKRIEEYNFKSDALLNEQKLLSEMSKNYYLSKSLKEINDKLEIKIYQIKNDLDDHNTKIEFIKNKKNSMSTLIESRDNLLKRKKRYDILSDVWSPKIGYPALQMEEWLDDLTTQTNLDLERMWGSDLKIESFTIGANEFSISVNRNGSIIKDASECSDGEKSTLSLAISFAVIEINLKYRKYNVLRFDELDGPFDVDRRRSFIDVLNNRLGELDCGSTFIISHNNEFGDTPADVIQLSETDEKNDLVNKTVIYNLRGE
ncbi:MAG: hypothetical protein ACRC5M_04785 [Anaeroplasmataceae bacterium]